MRAPLFRLVLLATVLSGCGGCGDDGLSTDLLAFVPADAQAVIVIDVARGAEDLRAYSPYARYAGRWNDLGDDLDEALRERLGVGLLGIERVVGWGADGDTWAAVLVGDLEGTLPSDGPQIAGLRAMPVGEAYLVLREGQGLVGTEAGLTQTVAVLSGQSPSLLASESEGAELLRDLLEDVGGTTLALAADAGDLLEQLGPLAPPARGFALSSSAEGLVARARLADPAAASSTATQLRALLSVAVVGVGEQAAALRSDPETDPAELLGAIAAAHTVRLAADELVTIDSQGADLVVSLDLRDIGGGMGFMGVAAAVAIPAFLKYIRQAQTSEARAELHRIFNGAAAYHAETGQMPSSAPRTPSSVPCGESATAVDRDWSHPTWRALHFEIDSPHRYSYQFDVSVQGSYADLAISAFGDLDCDGLLSTFILTGYVSGGELQGGDYIAQESELE